MLCSLYLGIYFTSTITKENIDNNDVGSPVTGFTWKLVLLGIRLYRMAAFASISASAAVTMPIMAPRRIFSSTLNWYESRLNCGSLSLASNTLTMTCVVALADGVPLSLAITVMSYRSRVSRSNVPRKYIQPLFGKMPNSSDISSEYRTAEPGDVVDLDAIFVVVVLVLVAAAAVVLDAVILLVVGRCWRMLWSPPTIRYVSRALLPVSRSTAVTWIICVESAWKESRNMNDDDDIVAGHWA